MDGDGYQGHDAGGRPTSLAAFGETRVWLMGFAMLGAVALILGLLSIVVVNGLTTFWPRPIERMTLRAPDGSTTSLMGIPVRDEAYEPGAQERDAVESARSGGGSIAGAFDAKGRPVRRLVRVGNRELGDQPFRWIPLHTVGAVERPGTAIMLERREWGVWIGEPREILQRRSYELASDQPRPIAQSVDDAGIAVRSIVTENSDGSALVVEDRVIAQGPERTLAALDELLPQAQARFRAIQRLNKEEVGHINERMEAWRLRVRDAELRLADATADRARSGLATLPWVALVAASVAGAVGGVLLVRSTAGRRSDRWGARIRVLAGLTLLLPAALGLWASWLERPWAAGSVSQESVDRLRTKAEAQIAELRDRYDEVRSRVRALEDQNLAERLVIVEAEGQRFAPLRQTELDEPMLLAQIVRVVQPNAMDFGGKLGVYLSRWAEFLADEPREINTEGGVLPVIVGTVLMTMLLSIVVVPLGVIAALYLREYARQGFITSVVRIAVNNLAGVPSIVYGVFGLGFFCYTMGSFIDGGPPRGMALETAAFWGTLAVVVASVLAAVALGFMGKPLPGSPPSPLNAACRIGSGLIWVAAVLLAAFVLYRTPYFQGLYRANLPNPTFGGRGLLWASLTLALLTLPVVIVATEEALAAVPRTMREGSYGCGASKWQTIRRIVLPSALPGIMTGMILAMARGAGEVAPLMIVGAVKLAPELPIGVEPPFIHLERSFMHLGFHIYDLGFQSPDSEAARPLVWTTTLLLIALVLAMNTAAIVIRNRLRRRLSSGVF